MGAILVAAGLTLAALSAPELPEQKRAISLYEDPADKTACQPDEGTGGIDWDALLAANPSAVAWCRVEGTSIDPPVCQAADGGPTHWLTHDFWNDESSAGTPYVDHRASARSQHVLCYGFLGLSLPSRVYIDSSLHASLVLITRHSFPRTTHVRQRMSSGTSSPTASTTAQGLPSRPTAYPKHVPAACSRLPRLRATFLGRRTRSPGLIATSPLVSTPPTITCIHVCAIIARLSASTSASELMLILFASSSSRRRLASPSPMTQQN